MEQIIKYQHIITSLLEEYASYKLATPGIESQVICDTLRHHYQLMRVGWDGNEYIHYIVFHFDIKDGKVWIQENRTDVDIAEALVERGIPKSDIVLGLQPPYLRVHTGYAAA
ncbi:MAG: XisI protein [Saprospiraceae bacterium]